MKLVKNITYPSGSLLPLSSIPNLPLQVIEDVRVKTTVDFVIRSEARILDVKVTTPSLVYTVDIYVGNGFCSRERVSIPNDMSKTGMEQVNVFAATFQTRFSDWLGANLED